MLSNGNGLNCKVPLGAAGLVLWWGEGDCRPVWMAPGWLAGCSLLSNGNGLHCRMRSRTSWQRLPPTTRTSSGSSVRGRSPQCSYGRGSCTSTRACKKRYQATSWMSSQRRLLVGSLFLEKEITKREAGTMMIIHRTFKDGYVVVRKEDESFVRVDGEDIPQWLMERILKHAPSSTCCSWYLSATSSAPGLWRVGAPGQSGGAPGLGRGISRRGWDC